LRQVTRDDVTGWLDGRKHQANDASALRDLFRTLKSERLVFTNPTDRVRVVKPNQTTPNRLTPETLQLIGRAAAQDPALLGRGLALVGVHAARASTGSECSPWSTWICPTPGSISAAPPGTMDPFTADAIGRYLAYRHNRWPRTGNPHLLVTRRAPFSWAPSLPGWQNNESKPEGPWVHEF